VWVKLDTDDVLKTVWEERRQRGSLAYRQVARINFVNVMCRWNNKIPTPL